MLTEVNQFGTDRKSAMFAPPARHPVHRATWRKHQGFS